MVGNERHDPGRNASRADVHEPRRSAIDLSMIFLISPWTCVVGRPSPTRVADRRRAEWETGLEVWCMQGACWAGCCSAKVVDGRLTACAPSTLLFRRYYGEQQFASVVDAAAGAATTQSATRQAFSTHAEDRSGVHLQKFMG